MMEKTMDKKRINFTDGPLFWRLIFFALPVMATGLLQMLYNAADKLVVGQFSGDPTALGAIGCTATLGAFIINFMGGIGGGTGVVVAQLFGARKEKETSRAVHTALILAAVLSLALTAVGYMTLVPALNLLGTQAEFMPGATLYLSITYIGIVATAVYNFGASILRAVGDSKSPLVIGVVSGLLNLLFNIVFVVGFGMSVDGVAIATVISQYFSAVCVILALMTRRGESYQFSFKKLTVDKVLLRRIIRIGVPTGLQSCCFTITNLFTVSAVNSFPGEYVTAFSVSSNIDGFLDVTSGAFMQSAMNATGQNYGAGKPKRIRRVFYYSLLQGAGFVFALAMILFAFRPEIAGIFVAAGTHGREKIIGAVVEWMGIMLTTYFMQGVMSAVIGTVRGLGYSLSPLILNIIGTCVVRAMWIFFVFPLDMFHTFSGLAMLYPVSWTTATLMFSILIVISFRKIKRMESPERGDEELVEI